jgi:hypothetical protein
MKLTLLAVLRKSMAVVPASCPTVDAAKVAYCIIRSSFALPFGSDFFIRAILGKEEGGKSSRGDLS